MFQMGAPMYLSFGSSGVTCASWDEKRRIAIGW